MLNSISKISIARLHNNQRPKAGDPKSNRSQLTLETLEGRWVPAQMMDAFGDYSGALVSTQSSHSLVILSQEVADSIPAAELSGSQVVILDPAHDPLGQIDQILAQSSGLQTLRIISHGFAGGLSFGGQSFSQELLESRSTEFAAWGKSFAPGADILLYGCSIASTSDGQNFVNTLSKITGADVAASTNPTGYKGDLTLEYKTGPIEAGLLGNTQAWQDAKLTLANVVTTSVLTSSLNPSLVGNSVTFSVVVSAASRPSNNATVLLYDGATQIGSLTGSTAQATSSRTYDFVITNLTKGTHSITTVYPTTTQGASTWLTSTSNAISQVVNGLATTTSVVGSPNPVVY